MSAAELLKQVKSLPPGERKKFVKSVLAMEKEKKRAAKKKTKKSPPEKVVWPDVLERAKRISGGRMMPDNIVIWDRERYDY